MNAQVTVVRVVFTQKIFPPFGIVLKKPSATAFSHKRLHFKWICSIFGHENRSLKCQVHNSQRFL